MLYSSLQKQALRLALFFLFTLGAQWGAGTFTTSFGGHPDAPAHYVSTVTMRNYILEGLPPDAVGFAREYYRHYPKVAIGHWPPLFYGVGAVWMLVFGVSKLSLFSLYALISALFAETIVVAGSRFLGFPLGTGIAAAALLLLGLRGYTTSVMLELPLALMTLLACLAFASFIERQTAARAVWFGLAASAAILTKGNAMFLAFLPPIALLFAGRLRLLLQWKVWISAAIVAVSAVPWMVYSAPFTMRSFYSGGFLAYLNGALAAYASLFLVAFGLVLAGFALIGFVMVLACRFHFPSSLAAATPRLTGVDGNAALLGTLAAAPLAFALFHVVTPSGWEDRYWYTVLGPICLLGGLGVRVISEAIGRNAALRSRLPKAAVVGSSVLLGMLAGELLWRNLGSARQHETGMGAIAERIANDSGYRDARVLVCCGGVAEGSMIAEMVLRRPFPSDSFAIVRGTKLLGRFTWSGRLQESSLAAPGEMESFLSKTPIDMVVYGESPGYPSPPTLHRLFEHVRSQPDRWAHESVLAANANGEGSGSRVHVFVQKGSLARPRLPVDVPGPKLSR